MNKIKAFFTPKSKRNKLKLTLCQEKSWENIDARESSSVSNEELTEQQKDFESLSVKVTSVSPRSPLSTSPVPNHFTFDFSLHPNSDHIICCSKPLTPSSPVRKWGMLSSSPLPSVQLCPRVQSSTDLRANVNNIGKGKLKMSESKTSKSVIDVAVNTPSKYNARSSPLGAENSKRQSSCQGVAVQTETGSSLTSAAAPNNTIKNTTHKKLNSIKNSLEKESRWSSEASTTPNVKDPENGVQSEVRNIFVHEVDGSERMFYTKNASKVGRANGAGSTGSKNHPSYLHLETSNTQLHSVCPTATHGMSKHLSSPKSIKTHASGEKDSNIRNADASTSLGFTEAVSHDQSEATSARPKNLPQDHRFQRIMELDDFTRQMLEIDIIRPLSYL